MVAQTVVKVSENDAGLTDWLAAGGSLLAALAAVVLLFLAYRQMRANAEQAKATNEQVRLMRAEGEEARSRRAEEDEAVRQQIEALAGIANETRRAARAQLQPIVFAHATSAHIHGPNDIHDISEGQIAFPYRIANEGTGIALNIRHGVEIAGTDYEFGDGMKMRVLRAGEGWPLFDPQIAKLIQIRPFAAVANEADLPSGWHEVPRVYWTRFESVFGERFETRNPSDPLVSASFVALDGTA